jgi:hypothetical protein
MCMFVDYIALYYIEILYMNFTCTLHDSDIYACVWECVSVCESIILYLVILMNVQSDWWSLVCVRVITCTCITVHICHSGVCTYYSSWCVLFYTCLWHCRPPHIDRAFTVPPELNRPHFDIVINLAAETRQSQPADLYDTRCTLLAKLCSQKAVDMGIPRFIQVIQQLLLVIITND